jgi:hypothetical protein
MVSESSKIEKDREDHNKKSTLDRRTLSDAILKIPPGFSREEPLRED